MARKTMKPSTITPSSQQKTGPAINLSDKLTKDAQQKIEAMKKKLDAFQKKVVDKFDKYILGVALMPPPKPKPEDKEKKQDDSIHVLVLVDDSDSRKLTKQELKEKLHSIIEKFASETDPKIKPQTVILSELWGSCYDQKYELLQLVALSAPVYDTGMLAAIKIAELHKSMVLKKFEKYIVSYVLSGSLIRGQATKTSDIDVFVVIDDTDVKKMTRAELKDKLRAIIIGMGIEAGEMTGIKNKLNIQVYILTDFWDSLKEANPIIFTLLRDGVPFYDRGIFMPWKQLLKMGKIKPSQEAIDMFMSSGEQMLKRVSFKLREMGMEDIYYAMLTPSQAALMLFGLAPPTPRETAELMREIFVKKEKLLEEKYVKALERIIKVRKDLEHGIRKDLSGKEIDDLLKDGNDYLSRIKKLFKQIDEMKAEESVVHIYDSCLAIVRDALSAEGVEFKGTDEQAVDSFEEHLVNASKIPRKMLRTLETILKAKRDYDAKKLTKPEIEKAKKESHEFIKFMIEYLQRKRARDLERIKLRIKAGGGIGEVLLFGKFVLIIPDISAENKKYLRAAIEKDFSLSVPREIPADEFEKLIAGEKIPGKIFIKEPLIHSLRQVFGEGMEIILS